MLPQAKVQTKVSSSTKWTPKSWHNYDLRQMPADCDPHNLGSFTQFIADNVELCSTESIDHLNKKLAQEDTFVIFAGDCCERFIQASEHDVAKRTEFLARLRTTLSKEIDKEVIVVARAAGQYAKPRSNPYEAKGGEKLPSYRGDMINSFQFSKKLRAFSASRMVLASLMAAQTADMFEAHCKEQNLGLELGQNVFLAHEALFLPYEEAFLREVGGKHFATSGHFLWVGKRTMFPSSAHVEFLSGVANPVGLKFSQDCKEEDLLYVIRKLNPSNNAGKVTLFPRFGHKEIKDHLPRYCDAVQKADLNVVWSCDPMHGNTYVANNGYKTRDINHIINEIHNSMMCHEKAGTKLRSLHLEATPDDVAECVGGSQQVREHDLPSGYKSLVDPRLNKAQSLDIMASLASMMQKD